MAVLEGRERWMKHYASFHQILLQGDGDFSSALRLVLPFGSGFDIVATSLDSCVLIEDSESTGLSKRWELINAEMVELLYYYIMNVAGDVAELKERLKILQAFQLEGVFVQKLRAVGHRLEDALDCMMLHGPRHSPNHKLVRKSYEFGHNMQHRSALHQIHKDIQSIRREVDEIYSCLSLPHAVSSPCSESPRTELQHHVSPALQDAEILGIEVSKQKLVNQLINKGEKGCSVVVVVGPPGSGKTVLVNSVYSSSQVCHHFSCKVRVRLSHFFDANDLLCLMLSQCRDGKICTTGDSATDLRNNLQGKRYLVILDDVWSERHWWVIKHALPDDSNFGRVVITTTRMDVASSIVTSLGHIHRVEGLQEEESWQLFCRKAFLQEKGICPPDLVELSQRITHKCEGSPLAISAVGSLLTQKKRLPSEWTKVHDNLRAEMETNLLFSDLNISMLQSYDDLHGNLKSCLLYFSLFPEGYYIERARLIRLWVAERFVSEKEEKPAEEVAEEYLDQLIKRHLVVANRDFDERAKSCRIRNFLHYFLTIKSRKEDFAAMFDRPSAKLRENVRRLSVADAFSNLEKVSGMQLNCVCTCIMFGPDFPPHIMEVSNQFKHLKVLDFQGAPLENFPNCVVELALLRYLSLRGSRNIHQVPRSIKKLRYLQFLDLKHTSVTSLPKEICMLHNLLHLLVYCYWVSTYITFDSVQGVKMTGDIESLTSLQKMTLLKAGKHRKFFDQLGNLTQLRKLGLIELRREDGKALCESLAKMKHLSVLDLRSTHEDEFLDLDHVPFPCNMLQRLYLKGRLEKLPRWVKDLKSIVRVHLRWSRLTNSPINELHGLKSLIELHLVDAFTGSRLEFRRDSFKNLKVLHLEELPALSMVEMYRGSVCNLQRLVLCKCEQLKTLPSGIERLSKLKELELYDMPVELKNRLQKRSSKITGIEVRSYISEAAKQTWVTQNLS